MDLNEAAGVCRKRCDAPGGQCRRLERSRKPPRGMLLEVSQSRLESSKNSDVTYLKTRTLSFIKRTLYKMISSYLSTNVCDNITLYKKTTKYFITKQTRTFYKELGVENT